MEDEIPQIEEGDNPRMGALKFLSSLEEGGGDRLTGRKGFDLRRHLDQPKTNQKYYGWFQCNL